MTSTVSQLRSTDLTTLTQQLADQRAHRMDFVSRSTAISARDGLIRIDSDEMYMGVNGFTPVRGVYRPTDLFLGDLADRAKLPIKHLRDWQAHRTDIFDFVVNRTLHGQTRNGEVIHEPNPDSHLFRGFWAPPEDGPGLARCLKSPNYKILDNYDILTALLDALNESGIHTEVRSADLTERRMVVKFWAPEINQLAENYLENYRSPFVRPGFENSKRVTVGARFGNSETGDGRFFLVPEVVVLVCLNGQTIKEEMVAKTHLGGRLDDGPVSWSAATQKANVELVRNQVKDVVTAWMNPEWLAKTVTRLETTGATPLANPAETVRVVAERFAYTEEQQASILDMYLNGGQPTAGGLLQAITAASQLVEDADAAHDMDMNAVAAMEFAAAEARKAN